MRFYCSEHFGIGPPGQAHGQGSAVMTHIKRDMKEGKKSAVFFRIVFVCFYLFVSDGKWD